MRICFVLLILVVQYNTYCQPDTIIRLDVVSGNSANFHFNSYTKLTSGIERVNWTQFRIYFKVHDGTGTGTPASTPARTWELLVHANNTQIAGDGGNNMSLDKVEVAVENAGSGTATAGIGSYVAVTSSSQATAQQLIHSGDNLAVPAYEYITISYRLGGGGGNSILGEASDYYFVDLVFTLNTQ